MLGDVAALGISFLLKFSIGLCSGGALKGERRRIGACQIVDELRLVGSVGACKRPGAFAFLVYWKFGWKKQVLFNFFYFLELIFRVFCSDW